MVKYLDGILRLKQVITLSCLLGGFLHTLKYPPMVWN